MKKALCLTAGVVLLLVCWGGTTGLAKETVLNNGFETASALYWTEAGPVPDRGVAPFAIIQGNPPTECYWMCPYTNNDGNCTQNIFLIAGVTYDVSADIAYYNC